MAQRQAPESSQDAIRDVDGLRGPPLGGATQRFSRLLYAASRPEAGLDLLDALPPDEPVRASWAARQLAIGDGLWLAGRREDAAEVYDALICRYPAAWLESPLDFRARLVAMELPEAVIRLATGAFSFAEGDSLVIAALDGPSLPMVVRLRVGLAAAQYGLTRGLAQELLAESVPEALRLGKQTQTRLTFARIRLAYLAGDHAMVRRLGQELQEGPISASELERCQVWSERVDWAESRPVVKNHATPRCRATNRSFARDSLAIKDSPELGDEIAIAKWLAQEAHHFS